jgi:hypothetical protein
LANRRRQIRFGVLFFSLLALGATTSATASADGFEPNNSVAAAAGPLLASQTYEGRIDSSSDSDFFYFYVTSASGARSRVELKNLGGGSPLADVDLTVLDSTATPRASISFLRPGETRDVELSLPAQKYYVEVTSREEPGDSYQLTTSGEVGAFGTYDVIADRCNADTSAARSLRKRLSGATVSLQRALNQVRRSRYLGSIARHAARNRYVKAKSAVATIRERRAKIEGLRGRWCSIRA